MSFKNTQTEKFKYRHKCLFPKQLMEHCTNPTRHIKSILSSTPALSRQRTYTWHQDKQLPIRAHGPSEVLVSEHRLSAEMPTDKESGHPSAWRASGKGWQGHSDSRGFLSKAEQMLNLKPGADRVTRGRVTPLSR